MTQPQLSRIENGHTPVKHLDTLERYAHCLRIPAHLLWFTVSEPDERAVDEEPPANRLRISANEAPAGRAIASHLRATLSHYVAMDNLSGPHALLPVVAHQLGFVERLLCRTSGNERTELLLVAARFAEFQGWLCQDAGDLGSAMRWTGKAWHHAQAAGASQLLSYVLMRKSNIASDGHHPGDALALAQAGLARDKALTAHLRAVLLRQQAYAFALRGERNACARALGHALDCALRDDDLELVGYCTPGYIEMEAANCWIQLGDPHRAIGVLLPGLTSWQPHFRRDLGLGLARLAIAYALAGEPDHAAATAQRSIGLASETRSARTIAHLVQAQQRLRTLAPRAARRLADGLRTID